MHKSITKCAFIFSAAWAIVNAHDGRFELALPWGLLAISHLGNILTEWNNA